MDKKSKIILIAGPTASGKSDFAIKLAKKFEGEIINSDSMQIYKEIKILNARPKNKEIKKITHHLYGFHSVKNNFSTGDWLKKVLKTIKQVKKKNKIPILVGGTGLYFKAIISGLAKIPTIPIKYRNKIRESHRKIGQKKFYKNLIKLDPLVKSKINANDAQRSIRAFEVKKYTKLSLFKWFEKTKKNFDESEFLKIYIDCPKEDLIRRINTRVNNMVTTGAITEVKKFRRLKVKKDKSSNKIIGISEISKFIDGEQNIDVVKDQISLKTRQYAKRQRTWARNQMIDWEKVDHKKLNTFVKKIKISSLKLDQ